MQKKESMQFYAVDIEKFSRTQCCGIVLQFLDLANAIDALVELNQARKRASDDDPNFFNNLWSKGALTFLQRQNSSIVFECLNSAVARTFSQVSEAPAPKPRNRNKSKPRILWRLLAENQSLHEQLCALEEFRLSGAYKAMDAIRDKLTAHADEDALKSGLKNAFGEQEKFGLVGFSNNGQFRAFFVDEASTEQHMRYVEQQRVEHRAYQDSFGKIRSQVVQFAKELCEAFCEENNLYADSKTLANIELVIRSVSEFHFLPKPVRNATCAPHDLAASEDKQDTSE